MRKSLTLVAIAIAVFGRMPTANAYNADGHMQIADIAWSRLTPRAKDQIRRILLAGDPMYCPASDQDADVRDAFRSAATFPDDIKFNLAHHAMYAQILSDWTYRFYPRHVKPTERDTEASACRSWHFYDTPLFVPAGRTAPPARMSNALVALPYAQRHMRSLHRRGRDAAMQAWWLYWTEHLVGDLHQPLHCVSSYAAWPADDAGGNRFALTGAAKNLHAYWDDGIDHAWTADGVARGASEERIAAATARWEAEAGIQPSPASLRDGSPKHWVRDGARIAETTVYRGIEQRTKPDPTYKAAHIAVCKRLALLAGYRLAAFLNKAL